MAQPPKKSGGGWGSLLSGAVAGLESRLDNILADEDTRAKEEAARNARLAPAKTEDSRASSKARANDRLAERLAKAAKGEKSSRPSSEVPSRSVTPLPPASAKASPRPSKEIARDSIDSRVATSGNASEAASARVSLEKRSIASPRQSGDAAATGSIRPSVDASETDAKNMPESAAQVIAIPLEKSPSFLASEVSRLEQAQTETKRNYEEQLHAHLEKLDALQNKLEYLAKQAAATAKETAEAAASGSLEKRLAEQEERNALLLEEGNKLSKIEIKQRQGILKLRQKNIEDAKTIAELKQKLVDSQEQGSDLRDSLKIAEEREKAAQQRLQGLVKIEVELDTAKRERTDALAQVDSLGKQLAEAVERAVNAEKKVQTEKLEQQTRQIQDLQDDLANARLEKRLTEDRAKTEAKQLREDAARQQEKANLTETELRNELQSLETKLEMLRSRTEEVTSSTTTDTQAKLLRQVETLQTQYSLASENWQTLEGTLNSRLSALQKERDDIAKREADVRKKAREANTKARRFEEDLEGEKEKASTFEIELNETKAGLAKMQTRLEQAEREMLQARADMQRERETLERDLQSKLEEERARWKAEMRPLASPNPLSATASFAEHNHFLSAISPTASWTARKPSDAGIMGLYNRRKDASSRTYSSDMPPSLATDHPSSSRRTPPTGYPPHPMLRTNTGDSSHPSRDASSTHLAGLGHNGNGSGSVPQSASASIAPSIDIEAIDDRMERDSFGSPHRTVNELVSHSTMAAGPSVQLVERMSAAVRRLETEKAAAKEERDRLLAQRDEARQEVVDLMREVDGVRNTTERLGNVEREMGELKTRYEASLEMLGEKSEEVEELRDDLEEVKKIYKEVLMQSNKT